MKFVLPTLLFIFSFAILGCSNSQEIKKDDEAIPALPKAILVTDFTPYGGSAPVQINKVSLVKNKMSISITYSGGCEKHVFQLLGSKMISKSLPPQRSIQLHHDNKGDSCREQLTETLVFDVSAFGYEDNEISLLLKGYREVIPYIPSK